MEAQLFPPGRGKVHVVVFHKYEGLCDAPNLPNTLQVSNCNIITFLKRCKIPSRGGCRWLFYFILNMRIYPYVCGQVYCSIDHDKRSVFVLNSVWIFPIFGIIPICTPDQYIRSGLGPDLGSHYRNLKDLVTSRYLRLVPIMYYYCLQTSPL